MKYQADIAVIGAGPVGLFCAFQAGMLGMKVVIIDVLDVVGGQCSVLYPQKPIYDIPAYPVISGQDLVDSLVKQGEPFKPVYLLGQSVDTLDGQSGDFKLTTSLGNKISCSAVIIASGNGLFGPNKPPIDNIDRFENTSVFYYVKEREEFRDKTIVIAGGGDSAVDWAISLADVANKIYFLHRRNKFRAHDASVAQLEKLVAAGRIEYVIPYQLQSLIHSNEVLQGVVVEDLEGQQKNIPADSLLLFFGLKAELGPINSFGLNIVNNNIVVAESTMQTNREGVYAVGDICTYPGKLKLILSGFAEVAKACHAAYHVVFPGKALHFEYSTSKGVAKLT